MTIRQDIAERRRPYYRNAGICGTVTLGSLGVLLFMESKYGAAALTDYFPVTFVAMVSFAVSYLALSAAMLLMHFRVHCPACKGRIGSIRRSWKHCPLCGISLDSDIDKQ